MAYPTREEQGFRVVELSGEIDLSCSPEARETILAALGGGCGVLVDLSGVSYIDSSGIASLVEGYQLARKKGLPFGLVGVSDAAMNVIRLARLDKVFPIREDVQGFLDANG